MGVLCRVEGSGCLKASRGCEGLKKGRGVEGYVG